MAASVALWILAVACGSPDVPSDKGPVVSVVTAADLTRQGGQNVFYIANRKPLTPSPLIKLPIGAIEPQGWLREQLERMARGMTGRLTELSRFCKAEDNAWISPEGLGHSPWEELPYWLKGFGDLGYVLQDQKLIDEARVWLDGILSSQDEDGWFGPRRNKEHHDCWPNMVALNCLQSFHEATGAPQVIPFMTRYFRWQLGIAREHLLPGSWQKIRGGDNLESIYWLYNRTGDAFLLELARVIHERTADWSAGIANWHGVNICQGFREPAEYYMQTGDPAFLAATLRNYDEVMGLYGQVPGGMFGADENCRRGYYGARQAAETCSMVEFMHSFEMLTRITADVIWADRCEEVAFNSLPPAFTPGLEALHYLTAPNMVQLDGSNKSPGLQNRGCMLAYSPHRYRCCQHNVAHGWPYFAEELWLTTPDRGLCASLYAPATVTARVGKGTGATVSIDTETDYPFGETLGFTITTPAETRFPLYLRIPGWCEAARVAVNGRLVLAQPEPGSYVKLDHLWRTGDHVELVLPMEVSTKVWKRQGNALSLHRGPLAYSLKIGERWERFTGDEAWQAHEKADLTSTSDWPAYEVFPTTPWNYGLVIDGKQPGSSVEVIRNPGPLAAQPFTPQAAPIELHVPARAIPKWTMEDGLVGALRPSPVRSAEPQTTVTLIPMGCARLRISVFPRIGDGPDANEWTVIPEPRASHCWDSDTVRALNDGIEPLSSADQEIPRLTWWDHRGSTEWVAYDFEEPRTISRSEVYWFDDSDSGYCRVPASWRLLWLDGEQWKPVKALAPYGRELNRYNQVIFETVTTRGIKLEAVLQEGFSAGILEWRLD